MFAAFRRTRRPARGFSLIELGIVIAVIAVLASVVIFGRGFITAGRISKSVEALNTIRKAGAAYAGLQGGVIQNPDSNAITTLAARGLLPVEKTATTWDMAGSGTSAITAMSIQLATVGALNIVAVKIKASEKEQVEDVYRSVQADPNYVRDQTVVGTLTCHGANAVTSSPVTLCFKI